MLGKDIFAKCRFLGCNFIVVVLSVLVFVFCFNCLSGLSWWLVCLSLGICVCLNFLRLLMFFCFDGCSRCVVMLFCMGMGGLSLNFLLYFCVGCLFLFLILLVGIGLGWWSLVSFLGGLFGSGRGR